MNQSALQSHSRLETKLVPKTVIRSILVPVPTPLGISYNMMQFPVNEYEQKVVQMITLRIICKAKMNGGYCYLGVDEGIPRLLRPIYNIEPHKCCWDVNFVIGSLIEFQVIHHPDNQASNQPLTAYPHRNEDLIVNKETTAPVLGFEWNPINLLPHCKKNIFEIFPKLTIQQNQKCFVYENAENAKCPSAGILLAEQKDIKIESSFNEWKQKITKTVHINNCKGPNSNMELRFSYTAVEERLMFPTSQYENNGKSIVILGLGRPLKGDLGYPFDPPRCYVLVVGILGFTMPFLQ